MKLKQKSRPNAGFNSGRCTDRTCDLSRVKETPSSIKSIGYRKKTIFRNFSTVSERRRDLIECRRRLRLRSEALLGSASRVKKEYHQQ